MTSTSGFLSTCSLIMSSAPPSSPGGAPSSAGWKMNFTVPGTCSFISQSILATPSKMLRWVSWPHACITGTSSPLYSPICLEAQGMSTRSFTGSPSMSARRPTTGPGFPPFKTATTPVLATPVCGSYPIFRSIVAIRSAVLNSRLLNSAFS